ncbi:hypothetical protein BCV70DRAFT_202078 [Testicularia cyperi]|uniref:F-box domain-containing protein n=1 Tax=Testicularia cyperi TaxID=1882483 RepID=A0A317XLN1_9BASI|nr:hypothetical protein BCV70DRAFT_202078 [Testicularia cyperi]
MLASLPIELQAYILVFLPAKVLVRTLSLTNRHFHDLVEAHVQRYCLRYLGHGYHASSPEDAAVLEFEAQRPIDTVTAKHTLNFSHFAPATAQASSSKAAVPPFSWCAVFTFSNGPTSKVATDVERSRAGRGPRRGRGSSVSVGPERVRTGPYVPTTYQPFLPNVHQTDQQRFQNQRHVSSSLDFEETVRPPLSRNGSSTRGNSRSASRSRARAIAQEIASAPFPFLRHSLETANRHTMASSSSSTGWNTSQRYSTLRPSNDTTLGEGLERPLDAYDWAGPNGTDAAPSSLESSNRSTRVPRKAAAKPACYAFQLDPLDSFESLILTLTAKRTTEDPAAVLSALMRGDDPSMAGQRMRYSKTLAEGLDRVFRDWFKPKAPPSGVPNSVVTTTTLTDSASMHDPASFSTLASTFGVTNSSVRGRSNSIPPEHEPDSRLLEFDNTSCVLQIQPHASLQAISTHPALCNYSSHDYLSRPPLSAQYASIDLNDRVELTFHCEHIAINTARLLTTLERLEHDVLLSQAKTRLVHEKFPRIVAASSSSAAQTPWFPSFGPDSDQSSTFRLPLMTVAATQ